MILICNLASFSIGNRGNNCSTLTQKMSWRFCRIIKLDFNAYIIIIQIFTEKWPRMVYHKRYNIYLTHDLKTSHLYGVTILHEKPRMSLGSFLINSFTKCVKHFCYFRGLESTYLSMEGEISPNCTYSPVFGRLKLWQTYLIGWNFTTVRDSCSGKRFFFLIDKGLYWFFT